MRNYKAHRERLQAQAKAYAEVMKNSKVAVNVAPVMPEERQLHDFIEPEGEIDYSKFVRNK